MTGRQFYRSRTKFRQQLPGIMVTVILLIGCLVTVIISLNIRYSPPALDPGRKTGTPAPDEGYLYRMVESDFSYSFGIAANLYRQKDGSVNIYLYDPPENKVSLMCEISDAKDGTPYYKSGRIEPGNYIESLSPVGEFKNEARDITVKIYAFEPETFESAGSTELKMILQAW